MTTYHFFSGKGGVGKTTMACATALQFAKEGRKTLIITTDPASNLSDVFETEIGHSIRRLPGSENLWGMEIDPDEATKEYRERILAPMRATMPESVLNVMEEQFNSPCTTEIASFDRFVDFMTEEEFGEGLKFDHIIFDTAPTGHTIRLLELPVDWSKHIEESAQGSGQTCIGPVASIQENKKKYDKAISLMADPDRTRFTFVLLAEGTSLYETRRAHQELSAIGVANADFIVNGLLPEEVCDHEFFRSRYNMQQNYLRQIEDMFGADKVRNMYQRDSEIRGVDGLHHIAADLYGNGAPNWSLNDNRLAKTEPFTQEASDEIEKLLTKRSSGTKSVYFTGKGGVGKTVVSCATAVHLAEKGYKTLLITTDPASHIGEVLGHSVEDEAHPVQGVSNLDAVIIDQEKATEEYKQRMLDDARQKYSEDMLTTMKEELESPCTEEMAAFDKFMEYVEADTYDLVVFDTAPTGHTLRLLELPFDYSDQVGMMFAGSGNGEQKESKAGNRLKRIIERMKDPEQSVFSFVLYPENTPIEEAWRAHNDLNEAGISTQFLMVNQIIDKAHCTNDFFSRRRAMQQYYLHQIRDKFQAPLALLPLLESEITGIDQVRKAAKHLFQHAAQTETM